MEGWAYRDDKGVQRSIPASVRAQINGSYEVSFAVPGPGLYELRVCTHTQDRNCMR
jgi:hypothetical protein